MYLPTYIGAQSLTRNPTKHNSFKWQKSKGKISYMWNVSNAMGVESEKWGFP